jgi:hypothetical protein
MEQRLDAIATAFFQRQLEYIKSKTYDTKYKNLKAKQFLPVDSSAPSGTPTITWRSYSAAGHAKIISDYAHDFPRVDIYGVENTIKVHSIGDSYGYSIKEIRRAQIAGTNLNSRGADIAKRAIEEKIDDIAWNGDTKSNIQGFLDYPGISEYTVPVGASTTTTWASKTPDEIILDMTGMINGVNVPTKGKENVNQILLPRTQYNQINNTRMTDTNMTILMYFKNNNPGIAVDVLDLLDGAGDPTGVDSDDRMMAYVKDPTNLTLELPQPFEQIEADKRGMEYVIPCHAEIGGVIVYYPSSVIFGDGI